MKKYYVIQFEGDCWLMPLAKTVEEHTNNIQNAGKWNSEEEALGWLEGVEHTAGFIFSIIPIYVKH